MDSVMVLTQCPFCGKSEDIEVELGAFLDWQDGMSIQQACPDMPAEKREQLISGICPKCWQKMFPAEDGEE